MGDLDIHDMAVDGDGRMIFVNKHFNRLAKVSDTHSFEPLWRRASKTQREGRCRVMICPS